MVVAELERAASKILGSLNRKEYDFFVCHQGHINSCLHEMDVRPLRNISGLQGMLARSFRPQRNQRNLSFLRVVAPLPKMCTTSL